MPPRPRRRRALNLGKDPSRMHRSDRRHRARESIQKLPTYFFQLLTMPLRAARFARQIIPHRRLHRHARGRLLRERIRPTLLKFLQKPRPRRPSLRLGAIKPADPFAKNFLWNRQFPRGRKPLRVWTDKKGAHAVARTVARVAQILNYFLPVAATSLPLFLKANRPPTRIKPSSNRRKSLCRRRDSNPHSAFAKTDFKSLSWVCFSMTYGSVARCCPKGLY